MDREALLRNLGLDNDDLQDLLRKFVRFQSELKPAQLEVVLRSLPNIDQAIKSLGPTAEDLNELFRLDPDRDKDVVQFYFQGIDGDGGN